MPHKLRLKRRLAASLTFAVLFFAGAAFTAGAGDLVADASEATTEAAAPAATPEAPAAAPEAPAAEGTDPECTARMKDFDREECQDDAAPAEPAPAEPPAPAQPGPAAAPADDSAAAPEQPATAPAELTPADASEPDMRRLGSRPSAPKNHGLAPASAGKQRTRTKAKAPAGKPVLAAKPHRALHATGHESASGAPEFGTMWLDRDLPDPTPPARRLTRAFARDLKAASRRHHVRWADVLAVLRARGDRGQAPAGRAGLDSLASRLAELGAREDSWGAFLALEGRTSFADRALALSRYHRAVGLSALVRGLEWAKPGLAKRVLKDERIQMYWGGREDVKADRIDVRILVLLEYLAEAHGQVTVSCLESGHGFYARPGVVSAHMYGLAVDIAALGNVSMTGHQQPGSVTETAVRNVLLLPSELRPLQVISLLGLGGPSFPLANHYDHIHVGY
ncbi:MAG TPA: hypothetical protein VKA45_06140 [Gaiellaceae bacterium]|nr:hypothetical protein [Gaiellaceae bacterium]